MEAKPDMPQGESFEASAANPYSMASKTPDAQSINMSPVETGGEYEFRNSHNDSSLNISLVLMCINLGLLLMLFCVMGPSGGFQFLFGFESSPQSEEALGGILYAIGCFIVFILRFAFFPAVSLLAIVGLSFSIASLTIRREQPQVARVLSIGMLVFHVLCLVPPIIFVIRTFVFFSEH